MKIKKIFLKECYSFSWELFSIWYHYIYLFWYF